MTYLTGNLKQEAKIYVQKAIDIAKYATCERSKCGAIIVQNDEIIGIGFNTPSKNLESQRRCQSPKDSYTKKVTDKTCCIHAEQRAITDALRKNASKLIGSRLYFIRLDSKGDISYAGEPYCTICSKMSLDVGIQEFVLYHRKGICVYNTEEYNHLSYNFLH